MGENTKIEWATHTLNFWTGCSKVSPACTNCYAESWAKRSGLVVWGDAGTRRRTTASNWRQAYKWDDRAQETGVRERVFVNSLSDWAEDRRELDSIRADMFEMIRLCPNLDWLLLTKRADKIAEFLPRDWGEGWPNVWLGVTAENQEWADKRIPHLLKVPAVVRFLSVEPMLGAIDLKLKHYPDFRSPEERLQYVVPRRRDLLHWVICGGESGPNARPMNPAWARSLRDQCVAAGVAFHFKQNGEYLIDEDAIKILGDDAPVFRDCRESAINRRIESGQLKSVNGETFVRVGKLLAGRLLDGREWNELPR